MKDVSPSVFLFSKLRVCVCVCDGSQECQHHGQGTKANGADQLNQLCLYEILAPPSLSSKKLETKNQEKKEKREREGEEEGARRRHEVEKERQSERSGAPLVLLLLRRKLHFSLSGVSLVSPVVRGFIRIFCSPLVIII